MIFAIGYFVCAVLNTIVSMIDYSKRQKTWIIPATIAVGCLILGFVAAIKSI